MSDVYARLQALDITLPPLAVPAAAYVPYVQSGKLIFVSGHIAKKDGKPWAGQLGKDMETAAGQQAARAIAIDLLGTLHAATGDLNKIARQGFGPEKGAHARSAFGVAQIPLGACVEIELIVELT